MAIKAIAVDIDGTLTNDEKVMTPATKEALMAAQRAGITLILASGRPAHGLKRLARELDLARHHGMLIAYNGSQVRDAATDEVLFNQVMSVEEVRAVLEHMKSFDVIPMIDEDGILYVEDAYRCTIEHRGRPLNIIRHERNACDMRVCEVGDLAAWCAKPYNKVLTAGTDTYLAERYREMAAPFEGSLSCMFTADFYFEFTAPDLNKGRALADALPKRGIDMGELVAFGDGQNDVAMLRAAGIGVAMGNAIDEAKDAADMVTLTNNEDGIAAALEKLL